MELISGKVKRDLSPEEQILEMVKQIKKNLDSGDSINVARIKVCGSTMTQKVRKIVTHPEYVKALNEYMIKIGKNYQYTVINGRLIAGRKNGSK